jgi:hypothetical protein
VAPVAPAGPWAPVGPVGPAGPWTFQEIDVSFDLQSVVAVTIRRDPLLFCSQPLITLVALPLPLAATA